jgi:hypothetical protein
VSSLALVSTTLLARSTGQFRLYDKEDRKTFEEGELLCVSPPYVALLILAFLLRKSVRALAVMSAFTVLFTAWGLLLLYALWTVRDHPDPGNGLTGGLALMGIWGGAGVTAVCALVLYLASTGRGKGRFRETGHAG